MSWLATWLTTTLSTACLTTCQNSSLLSHIPPIFLDQEQEQELGANEENKLEKYVELRERGERSAEFKQQTHIARRDKIV